MDLEELLSSRNLAIYCSKDLECAYHQQLMVPDLANLLECTVYDLYLG